MTADYAALLEAGETWVAADGPEVVGVLVMRQCGSSLLIENVAVAPGRQGRGFGRALMAHAERHARGLGLTEITLYTHERMTENRAYYASLGYMETGRRHEHGFDRVFFRKPLAR